MQYIVLLPPHSHFWRQTGNLGSKRSAIAGAGAKIVALAMIAAPSIPIIAAVRIVQLLTVKSPTPLLSAERSRYVRANIRRNTLKEKPRQFPAGVL
ncbi:hypothetical protein Q3C01_01145 [Bradyrhizobium sp. UFLA05-109]